MKNLKRTIPITSLLFLLLAISTFGQANQKRLSIQTDVSFNGQSEATDLKFPVLQIANLNMNIESHIIQGELTIELYDPQGEKQGNFTIGSPTFSSKESVRGSLSKRITNPAKGDWIVKFIPKNASGAIEIDCTQLSNTEPIK
jgi:hypothetical protein